MKHNSSTHLKPSSYIEKSQIQTFAKTFAKSISGGETVALVGNLGSGKTTFTQYVGKSLKIKEKITSPSFRLMAVHAGRSKKGKRLTIYHLDLYRIKSFREVRALGLPEVWGSPDTVVFIEWADKVKRHLPKNTHFIFFK